jgi:hypothetical protein
MVDCSLVVNTARKIKNGSKERISIKMNKNGSTQITMIGDSANLKIYTHIFL